MGIKIGFKVRGFYLVSNKWARKEWRDKRDAFLEGKSCEWCGSKDKLAIHHTNENKRRRYSRLKEITEEILLEQREKYPKRRKIYMLSCPDCRFENQSRKAILKKCENCGKNINFSIHPSRPYTKLRRVMEIETPYERGDRLLKEDWVSFWDQNKEEANRRLDAEIPKLDYMDFSEGVIVLCKKCHFAIHRGLILCDICKQHYKSPNNDMCSTCYERLLRIYENDPILTQLNQTLSKYPDFFDDDEWYYNFDKSTAEEKEKILKEEDEKYRISDQIFERKEELYSSFINH